MSRRENKRNQAKTKGPETLIAVAGDRCRRRHLKSQHIMQRKKQANERGRRTRRKARTHNTSRQEKGCEKLLKPVAQSRKE